jgi:hypothetical protein
MTPTVVRRNVEDDIWAPLVDGAGIAVARHHPPQEKRSKLYATD